MTIFLPRVLVVLFFLVASTFGQFIKRDFKENTIPAFFLGPYFNSVNYNDLYVDEKNLTFQDSKDHRVTIKYKVVDVNNYYPPIVDDVPSIPWEVLFTKRYILTDDDGRPEASKRLFAIFWLNRSFEGEKKLFAYFKELPIKAEKGKSPFRIYQSHKEGWDVNSVLLRLKENSKGEIPIEYKKFRN